MEGEFNLFFRQSRAAILLLPTRTFSLAADQYQRLRATAPALPR
jgi:hypothetical protein